MEESIKKGETNGRDPETGRFVEGYEGGPGRPKGKTLKEFARSLLMEMNDEEKREYLKTLPRDIVWKMAEGNPHNTGDVSLNIIPTPLDDVCKDEGIQEDKST